MHGTYNYMPEAVMFLGYVVTLVNDQLDAQFFSFVVRLLQSSICYEQRRAHHQEVKLYEYGIWYGHSLQVAVRCTKSVHRTAKLY